MDIAKMKSSWSARTTRCLAGMTLAAALTASAGMATGPSFELQFKPNPQAAPSTEPPLPTPGEFPVQLVLDDDGLEGSSGVNGASASQFMWFNQFTPLAGPFLLDQVWVLFEPGPNMAVGNALELVVYADADGDPTNGADLLGTWSVTLSELDGDTFSVYDLVPSAEVPGGADVYVGVIDRFVETGVTSPTFPAAIDTTASEGRSWFATWTGDPPMPPDLPTDNELQLVNGNWMIRAFGSEPPVIEVPTLDSVGLVLLSALLLAAGYASLRRRAIPLSEGRR